MLALGDSTYEKLLRGRQAPRSSTARNSAPRASRRAVDCDVDYEEPAAAWSAALADLSGGELRRAVGGICACHRPPGPSRQRPHDKRNPFAATVLENIRIVGRHSTKETRHVELDLSGSGLRYVPGDALGLAASNNAPSGRGPAGRAGLDGATEVSVKGSSTSLAAALDQPLRDHDGKAALPRALGEAERRQRSSKRCCPRGQRPSAQSSCDDHHVVDIVRRFPVPGVDARAVRRRPAAAAAAALFDRLEPGGAPDEAHLTVAPVRYELARRARAPASPPAISPTAPEMDATMPVYIQANPHFRLPADDVPIIMIGAGTGVAPYRAFLQEREARGAAGRSWLFFGERNFRSDFLYQTEWQALAEGRGAEPHGRRLLARRAASKIYVQHRMLRAGAATSTPGSRRARISMSAATRQRWRPTCMRR